MTLEEFARGAIAKVDELHTQLSALKEENERLMARVAELESENSRLTALTDYYL